MGYKIRNPEKGIYYIEREGDGLCIFETNNILIASQLLHKLMTRLVTIQVVMKSWAKINSGEWKLETF